MKSILYFTLTILFLGIVLSSCNKEIDTEDLIGKWKVTSLYMDEKLEPQKDTEYILEFKSDSSCSINLDVNDCWSRYVLSCDNCIDFGDFPCTKVCCDSEYAKNIITVLKNVKEMSLSFGKLKLKGDGKVILKKYKK